MIREKVKERVRACLEDELGSPGRPSGVPDFSVSSPPLSVGCDLAANAALVVSKTAGRAAPELARGLAGRLAGEDWCQKAEVAGPGFVNLWLREGALLGELREILEKKGGHGPARAGSRGPVLVEFVSANPTGPLHVGHGRGAALGDSIARILRFLGHAVTAEYYLNDVGNQIEMLGKSVSARLEELAGRAASLPENGYRGSYVIDIAKEARSKGVGGEDLGRFAADAILSGIRKDLEDFRVTFDRWSRESSLYEAGLVEKAFRKLREREFAYESEGALWFAATRFGDEKDRVLKRRDERPTYFASDIAYHLQKCEAGYERLINVWGADHHGYVPRLKGALRALGESAERLSIVLCQLVSLVRGGKPVSMSTRSGEFDTLRDLMKEVGTDACRFFYALRAPETHLEFDLELAKKQAPENPVFYVQYVHARIASIFREAPPGAESDLPGALALRKIPLEKEERALVLELSRFPETVRLCGQSLSPHHLTTYLTEVARSFHSFYEKHRVLSSDPEMTRWRLALLAGVRETVRQGLELLGVNAPEKL